MSFAEYLNLLDWISDMPVCGARDAIPCDALG